jgi:mannosyltransferase OCH1-like enzyme
VVNNWEDKQLGTHIDIPSLIPGYDPISLKIPAIIHQTWKSDILPWEECKSPKSSIPKEKCERTYLKWEIAYNSVKEMHPGYEYLFWTDKTLKKFIQDNYSWFLDTYNSYPHSIQRVDAARYFLLYHYGGIYMDLDIGCKRPLDPLRQFNVVLPATNPSGFSNDFLMSEPGHPFFKALITNLTYYNHYYGTRYPTVFISTGPYFLNHQYVNFKNRSDIAILPPHLYAGPKNVTYLAHYTGNSWHDLDAIIILGIYENYGKIIFVMMLEICVCILYAFWKRKIIISIDLSEDGQPHLE